MAIEIGLVIGFVIGMTGVGGGTLTAPVLILLMGLSPHVSVATALVFSTLVKVWASGVYLWQGKVDFRVLGYLLAGGLPGSILGAIGLQWLRGTRSDHWILAIVGPIVMVSAVSSLFRRTKQNSGIQRHKLLPVVAFPIGLETGLSSAGVGAMGSVALLNLTTLSPVAAVGTDLVFGMLVSAFSGSIHAIAGSCDWHSLAQLVPGGIAGSMVGTSVSQILPVKTLRNVVLLYTAGIGLFLLHRGIRELW